jgi:hypothetical protein
VSEKRHTKDKENGPAMSRPRMKKTRKDQAMITVQTITARNETEEALKGWLKTKSTGEVRQFLATAWISSLLSFETIEELYDECQREEAAAREEDASEVGLD